MKKSIIIGSILLTLSILVGCSIDVKDSQNFTIIVIPDSQIAAESYPHVFTKQIQWIADNKNSSNIKFVIHVGDIVQNWDSITQWDNVNKSLSILDKENIPYSVVPGNHDRPTTYYDKYFPVSRFSDNEWWGGSYNNDNDNNYQIMTINNQDYIFLSLNWCPNDDEIVWANSTLTKYSKRKAILTTHGYLNENAERTVHGCNTEYIWEKLIQHHANLQIVLCGHKYAEAIRTDYNIAGNVVYQMLADYQEESNGGNGWLRILKFAPSENKIYVQTYSPYLNQSQLDEGSQFALNYSFS